MPEPGRRDRLEAQEWERVLTVAFDEADRPPDNEAAVLFGVEPVVHRPRRWRSHPPKGTWCSPATPTNWITTGTGVCCNSASVNTTGGVTHDYGGNAGCNLAGSSPYTPAGTYSQWGIAGTHRRLEWKLRIDDDDPGHGHFWAMQSSFQVSPEQFYAGLQRNGTVPGSGANPQKLALFSVWGALSSVAGTAAGAVAEPFVEGSPGYRVVAPYTWTLGATVTLRVQADDVAGSDWWRFDVIDDATGTITYIGSVQVPAAWGDINGAYAIAFTEWFTDPGGRHLVPADPPGDRVLRHPRLLGHPRHRPRRWWRRPRGRGGAGAAAGPAPAPARQLRGWPVPRRLRQLLGDACGRLEHRRHDRLGKRRSTPAPNPAVTTARSSPSATATPPRSPPSTRPGSMSTPARPTPPPPRSGSPPRPAQRSCWR